MRLPIKRHNERLEALQETALKEQTMCTEDSDSVIQDEKPTSVCLKGIVKSPTSQKWPIPSTHTNMNHKCIKVSVCHVTDLTKIGN